MSRAHVVNREQAIDELTQIVEQLKEGAFRVGDTKVEIPKQILYQNKFRKGDHQGIDIRLSWDIIEEEEAVEEDPEDREWHDILPH
ncbi:hypothetical protein H1S01_05930 [Heliobacterium chlorum]|uniref:Amphi-Trp domain-containing protein n=1 Tax=Heliobacterium chlorum TaxID=2698 RepID=A0ABR7T037_HELCL|nr:hypothetical protein [Heliobacterium chlorum]MBC9784051.1 hypothetical protein [Heliobacterium chlorum]